MDLTINTPALLFPALTLIMLAYTNRFLTLGSLIRNLHTQYLQDQDVSTLSQLKTLKLRVRLIRDMQALGIFSLICCVLTMFCIYINLMRIAEWTFVLGLIFLLASLLLSAWEVVISTKALNIRLGDIQEDLLR